MKFPARVVSAWRRWAPQRHHNLKGEKPFYPEVVAAQWLLDLLEGWRERRMNQYLRVGWKRALDERERRRQLLQAWEASRNRKP